MFFFWFWFFFFIFFFFIYFFNFFYEDSLHDEKEKTLASAGCVLEELKVSLIPEKMEIIHELDKGNSPRGIVKT